MKASWVFLSLVFVVSRTLASEVSTRIVNGTDVTNIATYPSFSSLFYISGGAYSNYCGATMLNSQYALTAAHCIYDNPSNMLNTFVIPQLLDESNYYGAEKARASEFYYPDDYIDSGTALWPNDIAIIKLETPLSTPDYTYMLNTTYNNNFPSVGGSINYYTIGHGLVAGNVSGSTILQQTTLEYVSWNDCRFQYGAITDKQICFGGAQSGSYKNSTCNGDSGGPVYLFDGAQYIQIGITSFGPNSCGNPSLPVTSVFTDIYDYIGWVNRVINGQEIPKYYVTTTNGQRVLVSNVGTSSSGSGGGIGFLTLFSLLLMGIFLKHHRAVMPSYGQKS
ncbi:serine protease [Vibrio zhanjiangensis]|uniref:Serine protease n=1 Tax=Vibrio zhanjiangensis TaxID=1046128 RepID=A0ABQ6F206_9VIBR|nr:trypsin-like serine protease [Vibrio zhanjiangensis]GLT18830.1 serine protease [Vibrio zhanjiangensis]